MFICTRPCTSFFAFRIIVLRLTVFPQKAHLKGLNIQKLRSKEMWLYKESTRKVTTLFRSVPFDHYLPDPLALWVGLNEWMNEWLIESFILFSKKLL